LPVFSPDLAWAALEMRDLPHQLKRRRPCRRGRAHRARPRRDGGELRRLARLEDPAEHSVEVSVPGYGRRVRHFPDFVVERPGGARWAIKAELTQKGRRRLQAILQAFAAGPFDAVAYLVPEQRAVARIQSLMRDCRRDAYASAAQLERGPALWVVGPEEPYRALLDLEAERCGRIAELRELEARREAQRIQENARRAARELTLQRQDEERNERERRAREAHEAEQHEAAGLSSRVRRAFRGG
jgi:hypothetical protein